MANITQHASQSRPGGTKISYGMPTPDEIVSGATRELRSKPAFPAGHEPGVDEDDEVEPLKAALTAAARTGQAVAGWITVIDVVSATPIH